MQNFYYGGNSTGLALERKKNWASGVTTAPLYFVHGGAAPGQVASHGLSPAHAREYLVDETTGARISGGKMLFSFLACAGGDIPANARKPSAVNRFWGYNGHAYVFRAPSGTTYWSQNGLLVQGTEIAFEYVIENTDIVQYWAPSDTYVRPDGEVPNPAMKFQRVDWAPYLINRATMISTI